MVCVLKSEEYFREGKVLEVEDFMEVKVEIGKVRGLIKGLLGVDYLLGFEGVEV